MDVELVKIIAAVGGLGVALVALELFIFERRRRSPKLALVINKASIRSLGAGTFDCQIDIEICAKGREAHLQEMAFSHTAAVFDPDKKVNRHVIRRLIDYPGYCTLDAEKETFSEKIRTLLANSLPVAEFKLAHKETKRMTLIESISIRPCDGEYWDWPTAGWTLAIQTSIGNFATPLTFSVHESNTTEAFCLDYGPTQSLIWSC